MLHATFHRGHSNLYKRYTGHRDPEDVHVHEEDEITSTVIGPLDLLPPIAVHRFWFELLLSVDEEFLSPEPPVSADIKLWDSRPATDGSTRIEPDCIVEFKLANGERRILLVEFKWRAPLSGKNQLRRQWLKYLTEDERGDALHIFIGIKVSAAADARYGADSKYWQMAAGNRLVLISWLQVRSVLGSLKKGSDKLALWARLSDRFLERVGIRRFSGFSYLQERLPKVASTTTPLFWSSFRGWGCLATLPDLPERLPARLFYSNSR